MSDLKKSALAYAKLRGWSVFPCEPNGKNPLTPNGLYDATRDLDLIERYWNAYPNANIGIPAGKENGFIALDVDGEAGEYTLEDLVYEHGELPHTIQAITGSGGSHYLFQYQEGVKNKVGFEKGMDCRSDGGYIIVSPSVHETGNEYMWEFEAHPLETQLAMAPDWLINRLKTNTNGKYEAKPLDHWVEAFKGAEEGTRNDTTASITGYLLRKNIDPPVAWEIVKRWNESNQPREELDVIEKTFNSILEAEIRRREGVSQ